METLAVLFADICGSTALYEELGDETARRLISRCIAAMTAKIPEHRGTLVKTIGDEILVTFPDAETAYRAACAMQESVADEFRQDNIQLHIRVGLNYGEVLKESSDIFGNVVNVASRVVAITRADQIMATQEVLDALPAKLQERMRHILRAEFKGKKERHEIYQVIAQREDMLITRPGMLSNRKTAENTREMLLSYRDRSLRVNKERRSVMLGRGEICDLPVQNDFASRMHSHVELRSGKFVLVDQSTNGTYVRFGDGSVQHITREELILHGNGTISLGHAFDEGDDEPVEFRIVPVDPEAS